MGRDENVVGEAKTLEGAPFGETLFSREGSGRYDVDLGLRSVCASRTLEGLVPSRKSRKRRYHVRGVCPPSTKCGKDGGDDLESVRN